MAGLSVRLTDPRMFAAQSIQSALAMERQVVGLSLSPGTGPLARTVQMDWVRLTAARTVRLAWQCSAATWSSPLTDGTQTVQVFPEDLTPLANAAAVHGRQPARFPDNSSVTWDYGHLTPGTWTITARGAGATQTASLVVDASPALQGTQPGRNRWRRHGDARSSAIRGTSPTVRTCSGTRRRTSALFDVKNAAFTAQGLTGVAWRSGPSATRTATRRCGSSTTTSGRSSR